MAEKSKTTIKFGARMIGLNTLLGIIQGYTPPLQYGKTKKLELTQGLVDVSGEPAIILLQDKKGGRSVAISHAEKHTFVIYFGEYEKETGYVTHVHEASFPSGIKGCWEIAREAYLWFTKNKIGEQYGHPIAKKEKKK